MSAGQWEPAPPRPGSLDDAQARGFDPETVKHDRVTPEPLSPAWQDALNGAIETARHFRCGVDDCGNRRCSVCDERLMCTGPEPAANTCGAHESECQSCNDENPCRQCAWVRKEARAS